MYVHEWAQVAASTKAPVPNVNEIDLDIQAAVGVFSSGCGFAAGHVEQYQLHVWHMRPSYRSVARSGCNPSSESEILAPA
jgi:hypothetical protein